MEYYVWPDGSFVSKEDYSELEYQSFGDDYQTIDVPDTLPDLTAIECYIAQHYEY